jgi:hypothetical protein
MWIIASATFEKFSEGFTIKNIYYKEELMTPKTQRRGGISDVTKHFVLHRLNDTCFTLE